VVLWLGVVPPSPGRQHLSDEVGRGQRVAVGVRV